MLTRTGLLTFLVGWLFAGAAYAEYPAKPVRFLVGFAPGGGADISARTVAHKLSEVWKQPVVVENKAGAAGNIAADAVAKAAPDGYTLLWAFSSHASNPALYSNLPFDVNKDFAPISLVATAPVVITVHPKVPVKTLGELIDYGRSHSLKLGSSGVGTPVHLGGELLQQLTGMKITHVPYKGIAPAMAAMLAGDIDMSLPGVLSGLQHFRSGRLVPLAIAGRNRYPGLPDVPTAAEAGLANFEIDYWYAVLGPAKLPALIVERVNRDIAAIVMSPSMKQTLLGQGTVAVGGGPDELSALIQREYALWAKVVKAGGVKIE